MPFSSVEEVQEGLLNPAVFPVRSSLVLIARALRRVLPLADLQNLEADQGAGPRGQGGHRKLLVGGRSSGKRDRGTFDPSALTFC